MMDWCALKNNLPPPQKWQELKEKYANALC